MVAKALGRQGNAHRRLGELDKAKVTFEKALTEHRTPDYRDELFKNRSSRKMDSRRLFSRE